MDTFIAEWMQQDREALEQYRRGAAAAPMLYRSAPTTVKASSEPDGLMTFVASEESEDRMGDVIKATGWQLDNFRRNPVFLYVHDQTFPPIGKVMRTEISGKQLTASVKWDEEDEFARLIKGKYAAGIMNAVSVGFRALEFEDRQLSAPMKTPFGTISTGMLFTKVELVEISAVPVPAHPKALKKALGSRSTFWVPFVPRDEPSPESDLKQLLQTVSKQLAEVAQASIPTPKPEAKPPDGPTVADVLFELRQMKED